MVTLVKCATLPEADAVRTHLEGAGIGVFLPDENLMQAVAWNANTYGFIRVQVASTDYQKANQVLSSMKQEFGAEATEASVSMAELSLSSSMKCFAFLMPLLTCPGLLMFAMARNAYSSRGCTRKAAELSQWFAVGLAFWMLVIATLVGMRSLMK